MSAEAFPLQWPEAGRAGRSVEYRAWRSMIERCCRENCPKYPRYGGRGIIVCRRWRESFYNFLADVGRRPSPDLTIERDDTNGNYEPSNVRWATQKEQQRNKSTNRIVEFDGARMSLAAASERAGAR